MKACAYCPTKGAKTFYALKNDLKLGYNLAWDVWGIASSNRFKNDYKDSLKLDEEGIPTLDSILKNPYLKEYISRNAKREELEKQFTTREDTLNDYSLSINDAIKYNKNGTANDRFVAIVERDGKNITTRLVDSTPENIKKAHDQEAAHILNQRLADILSPIGVTVGILSQEETKAGRAGVTDFTIAKNIATDSISLIKVANNMEGSEVLSEEFCHVIVRALKDNPLVSRVKNILKNNPKTLQKILGDDYNNILEVYDNNMDLVVEEAVGQMLRDNLLSKVNKETTVGVIENRLYDNIKKKFKRLSISAINSAMADAEGVMDDLAKQILNPSSEVRQSIKKTRTEDLQFNAQFNALSNRVERDLKLIKDFTETQIKKYKIKGEYKKNKETQLSKNIKYFLGYDENSTDEEVTKGVIEAVHQIVSEYSSALIDLQNIDQVEPTEKFTQLRNIRNIIKAYAGTMKIVNDILVAEEDSREEYLTKKIVIDTAGGHEELDLKSTISELKRLSDRLTTKYMKTAMPMFAEFLRSYLGDEVLDLVRRQMKNPNFTIEDMITSAEYDISFLDYWLDAMAHSSNVLLQGFGKIIDTAKTEARLATIDDIKEIQALRQEADLLGIKSFDWMFERYDNGKKTGNYISEVNQAQFDKELAELDAELDEKYGENPETKEDREAKLNERRMWLEGHSNDPVLEITAGYKTYIADPTLYRNEDYDNLSDDERYILEKFCEIKSKFDYMFPSTKIDDAISQNRAIQIRKNGIQRLVDMKSPSAIWSNIKESVKKRFTVREDDIDEFGESRTLTDFDGKEFMVMPVLYVDKLQNPEELSTDVFSTLIAYAAAANEFDKITDVLDALEVGRDLVNEHLEVQKGDQAIRYVEHLNFKGHKIVKKVYKPKGSSNIAKKLNAIFESQIYHRYVAESRWNGQNLNKIISNIIWLTSNTQLAVNFLAGFANITNGLLVTNVEVAAGKYFSWKDLLKADWQIFFPSLPHIISELWSRNKTSKVELFDELFNIKNGFDNVNNRSQRNSFLYRIFGRNWLFFIQEMGDFWLYNRVAIAHALKTKVRVPGKGVMSLWDAVEIVDAVEGNNKIKKAILPEGITYEEDDKGFDIHSWSKKVWDVNSKLYGVYNTDDKYVANRVWYGKLVMLYRNWIKPQFNKRYQLKMINTITGEEEEGFYITTFRFFKDVFMSRFQLTATWGELNDNEKASVRRFIMEAAQIIALLALKSINWGGGDDDKKRPWRAKFARYMAQRTWHEYAIFAPGITMTDEASKTIKSLTPVLGIVDSYSNLAHSLITPTDWTTELKSGKYKGWTKLEKNLYKVPCPVLNQIRQIERFTGDLDPLTTYLARPAGSW